MSTIRVAQILSLLLEGSPEPSDVANKLVVSCAAALPVTGVGLALMTDAGPAGSVAISDRRAGTMEDLQFTLGEGPCVESSQTGRPVLQPYLLRTGPGRWPAFSASALDAGVQAVFALPLRVGGIRLGVLGLYRDEVGVLSDSEMTEALSFADAATVLLLHLQAQSDPQGTGNIPLIEDRAEVHQATGMVSVQAEVTVAEALVRLRARAYATDRPILDLARDVLARRLSFEEDYDEPGG